MSISTQSKRRRNAAAIVASRTGRATSLTKSRTSRYQPVTRHRKVRHQFTTPDGVAVAKTKSFRNDEDEYTPVVNLADGSCSCTCADFEYRRARLQPNIADVSTLCKHLARYVARLEQRGELQPQAQPVSPSQTHLQGATSSTRSDVPRTDFAGATMQERRAAYDARLKAEGRDGRDDF